MAIAFYLLANFTLLVLIGSSGLFFKKRIAPNLSNEIYFTIYLSVVALISFFTAYFAPQGAFSVIPISTFFLGAYSLYKNFIRKSMRTKAVESIKQVQVLIYLAILPLAISVGRIQTSEPFSDARTVFTKWGLPIDNEIPSIVAKAIVNHEYQSPLFATWLGSDRPPLQSGFLVLVSPFQSILPNLDLSYFSVSYLLQVTWLFALYALLRRLNLSHSSSVWIVSFVSFTGFVTINAIYSWPKLFEVTFLLLAMSQIFSRPPSKGNAIIVGTLFGLGMLSHGGAAFAFPGLLFLFWSYSKGQFLSRFREISILFLSAFFVQIPWLTWQIFIDPPGNRLIKMHLAGIEEITSSSSLVGIVNSYSNLSWSDFISSKIQNFQQLYSVPNLPFSPLTSFLDPGGAKATDFFSLFGSISWLFPGAILALILWVTSNRSQLLIRTEAKCHFIRMACFVLITLTFWCLVMFVPGSTINHHGTYIQNLVSLSLLAYSITYLKKALSALLLLVQSLIWLYVYAFSGLHYTQHFVDIFLGVFLTILIFRSLLSKQVH